MGNSAYGSAWRAYARLAPSGHWLSKPLWGIVDSERQGLAQILCKFRLEVVRYAQSTHDRFHAIYLYEERTRRIKCLLESEDVLVLLFSDAELRAAWCEAEDEAGTPAEVRLFASAWERHPLLPEDATTMRWKRRVEHKR